MGEPTAGGNLGGTVDLEGLGLDDAAKKRVENIIKAALEAEVATNPSLDLAQADWRMTFAKF